MKTAAYNKRLFKIALISLAVIAVFMIFIDNQNQSDIERYKKTIVSKRSDTDRFMKTSDSSPFKDLPPGSYTELNYYEPDPNYRVQAIIKPIENGEQLIIPTSDGKKQRYQKFAFAEFKLGGNRHRLLLLKQVGFNPPDVIFTAFVDATSGDETYGGGRYLDLSFKNARQITIDFNLAYNPYCAYNPTFSCPLPPKENILPIPIRAGEKNYD